MIVDLGKFYAVDPTGQDWSPFAYAGNNPVLMVDPDGRVWNRLGNCRRRQRKLPALARAKRSATSADAAPATTQLRRLEFFLS